VIVTGYTGTLHIVNTGNNTVYGPFLEGQLGTEDVHLSDIAVTPDGKTALIANSGDANLSFVDISNPLSPSLLATVTLQFTYTNGGDVYTTTLFPQDIAITQDGKFAVLTDRIIKLWHTSNIATIDIAARKVITGMHNYADKNSQAVAIAPDNTVVFADALNGLVRSYLIDDQGYLIYGNTVTYTVNQKTGAIDPTGSQYYTSGWYHPKPINMGVAPDGETVILCDYNPYTETIGVDYAHYTYQIGAYRITAPGVISFTQAITGVTAGNCQSVAFSATGDKAYLFGNDGDENPEKYNHLTVLDITGPGEISLDNEVAAEIPRYGIGGIYGMESMAIINNKAYIGHEGDDPSSLKNTVYVVDLNSFEVLTLTLSGIPTDVFSMGVAAIPYFTYVPFLIQP
jgi:DNA-binding beta-propeller fold protein YncE